MVLRTEITYKSQGSQGSSLKPIKEPSLSSHADKTLPIWNSSTFGSYHSLIRSSMIISEIWWKLNIHVEFMAKPSTDAYFMNFNEL